MKSIRSKILISIIVITFITSLAVTVVFYNRSASMVEEKYISIFQQQGQQTMERFDEAVKDICRININASCDPDLKDAIQRYQMGQNQEDLEQIADILRIYSSQNKSISSMYAVISGEEVLVTSRDYPTYRKVENMEAVSRAVYEQPVPSLNFDPVHEEVVVLTTVEEITDNEGNCIGYIRSDMEEGLIYYDYLAGAEEEAVSDMMLLNRQGGVISSTDRGLSGSIYDKEKEAFITGSDHENIYIRSKGIFSGCSLFVTAKKEAVLHDLRITGINLLGILFVFTVLALIPAVFLTSVVHRPVNKLSQAMSRVSNGDVEARAEVVSKDEIGVLAGNFNEMLEQIEKLIGRVIEEENRKKDAELEALQYQITPHFMYNTLNSIKYAAYIKGEKELGGIIGEFVELLQASIGKHGTFITVEEEIHMLKNYIHIQEFRYGGHFSVIYDIDPKISNCMVPHLLLQPLVENALMHGLDMKAEEGIITVSARESDGKLILKIKDNGRGLTSEQAAQLMNSKKQKTERFAAIGIPNIQERLRLYYKEEAELIFNSSQQGTTAAVSIPLEYSGEGL